MSESAAQRPLRILHVVEAFGGGVFEIVKTLAERLAAGGDTVGIAFGRRPETPAEVEDHVSPAVELYPLPWGGRSAREQLTAARGLRSLARSWRPDVIHLHSSFAGVIGAIVLPRSVPCVYTPHGYSFTMQDQSRARRLGFRALERFTAARVCLVGAVSEAEARTARTVAAADKVVVVRNGIPELDDLPAGAPIAPLGEQPAVIALGRITGARMPAQSARILASVADLAAVAWVGGGGRGDVPTSVVTDLGVPVSGWMDHAEALGRLRSATALLHWTAWDGQPLSLLEAMASDTVVIARDIEPTREIVGPRQVCAGEDEATELLRRVLTSQSLREELLQSQRLRRADYGAQRMADEWQALYRRLDRPRHP